MDVWWEGGHGACSFRSGSVENSPLDGASRARFSFDPPSLSTQALIVMSVIRLYLKSFSVTVDC